MREKILAALLLKFAGMSKEALGLLADLGAKKVTEEDKIEGFITELENSPIPVKDFVDFLQKEGDKRVTTAKAKWESENKKPEPTPTPAPKPDEDPVLKKLSELEAKYAAIEAKEKQLELAERFQKYIKDNEIDPLFAKGRSVLKEEDFEAVTTELKTDWGTYQQSLTDKGLGSLSKPAGGNPSGGTADEKAVEGIVDNMLPNF